MNKIKYPRTYHLPYSVGRTDDDKSLSNDQNFINKKIVITEKMDGENTTIGCNYVHARSIDSKHRDYHSWLLNFAAEFQYTLPEEYRICGEYMYAIHSIYYGCLPSYFLGFSLWYNKTCMNWAETKKYFDKLGIVSVPEIYIGHYDKKLIDEITNDVIEHGGEGIVVRTFDAFSYDDFNKNVAKWVRPNHVTTDQHWSKKEISINHLEIK